MKKLVLYFDPKPSRMFNTVDSDTGEKKAVLSSPHNFVSRSQIVARVINIDNDDQIQTRIDSGYKYYNVVDFAQFKIDAGIYYDEAVQAYKASTYGFVVLAAGVLKLISALNVSRDKLKAVFIVHPTNFGKIPTANEIMEYMQEQKILAGVGQKKIETQLAAIDANEKKVTRILVAQGKTPVNGIEETFQAMVDFEKKAGEIKSDGSIDFKEVGSVVQVFKGQEILQRIPPVKPVDGMDVFGNITPAVMEEMDGFRRGENIVQSGQDENIFLAGIDGVLKVVQKKVSILETVIINGDVDYNTGNIDFKGSVQVTGSVLAGFHIKAKGDVEIKNSVEDALIEAEGNVTVGTGCVGKESVKVICGGTFKSKYLLNATIEAGGDVIVEDSIINSNVFSNKTVNVTAKTGKIIGGDITALYDILVKVAGAPNETPTVLSVGRNLYIEKELELVRKEMNVLRESVQEVIRKLRTSFGESVFEDPKKFIAILPPLRQKACLELLKDLNNGNKELKALTEKSQLVAEKLKLDKEPAIVVYDRVYPGTTLNIKKRIRKIDREYENAKFIEDLETRDIRFTSAV